MKHRRDEALRHPFRPRHTRPQSIPQSTGAIEIGGVTADSRAVKPGDLFVAIAGAKADGLRFAAGCRQGRRRRDPGRARAMPSAGIPVITVPNARRALSLAAAKLYPRQPATIAAITGTSGKTSVAAFTRQIWETRGLCGGQHRHHRRGVACGRDLWVADHARSGGLASHARSARGRGRDPSGDGSLVARPRPVPARRRARRGRRLHQSQPRSSRLSSRSRLLSARQASPVRGTRSRRTAPR